jgi:glycosyltransferase involved in cell wall biosynthesis
MKLLKMYIGLKSLIWIPNLTKILRIITRLNIGGPSKQILTLNSIFDESQLEQKIITGKVGLDEEEIELSSFSDIEKIESMRRGINPLFDLIAFLKICIILKRFRPQIIHTHLSKAWAFGVLAKMSVAPKTKIIHTFHGHILHSYFSGLSQILTLNVQRFLASKTDVLVAVNETIRAELISNKIGVNSNFEIASPGFKAPEKIDYRSARNLLGLKEELFTIGFIGRFEKIKRPDILAEVVKLTTSSIGGVQFLFCGGGSLYEVLQKEIKGLPAICLPWAYDLSPFYSSLDLMILVSDNEGTPLTVIEAGKVGIPTLSRYVGGIKGLINDSVNGFTAGDTSSEIVNRIRQVVGDRQMLKAVSQETERYFNEKFSEEVFLQTYERIYSNLSK